MSVWNDLLKEPTCGNKGCFMHRLNSDVIQGKYVDRMIDQIMKGYTVEELSELRQVANGMG